MIFDSLNFKAGKTRIPLIRQLLRKLNLITKRDKCEAIHTSPQSEKECGPHMVKYMLEIERLMHQRRYDFGTLKYKIDQFLQHEQSLVDPHDEHLLALKTRKNILDYTRSKQVGLKSL